MAGPTLCVLTYLSVIYTPIGVGGKGLWSHQCKVGAGCGSPYQVLKTSRHGAHTSSPAHPRAAPPSREVFPPVRHDALWVGAHCPMLLWSTATRRAGLCCLCNCPSRNCRLLLDLPLPPCLQIIMAQFLPLLFPGPGR